MSIEILICDRCGFKMEFEGNLVNKMFSKNRFNKILGKQLCHECYGQYIKNFMKFMEDKK